MKITRLLYKKWGLSVRLVYKIWGLSVRLTSYLLLGEMKSSNEDHQKGRLSVSLLYKVWGLSVRLTSYLLRKEMQSSNEDYRFICQIIILNLRFICQINFEEGMQRIFNGRGRFLFIDFTACKPLLPPTERTPRPPLSKLFMSYMNVS